MIRFSLTSQFHLLRLGLRVGVSVANDLGWSLGIPVNGKDLEKGEVVEIEYE